MLKLDIKKLATWFLEHKRELPWRENPSPYAVWISEVMLQQTQVSVVIPYFERWMQLFPTITHLAAAPLEQVIKAWEGLGYYSRARNLHESARFLVEKYQGELPQTEEALLKIKGLGPYTVGAIRSFAFHQKAPAIDGNVLRVIARLLKITEPIDSGKTQKAIRQWVEEQLPDKDPWIISEALIELGATICMKSPECSSCPLRTDCLAFREGIAKNLPYKAKKTKIEKLFRIVPIIRANHHILIQKGEKGKIMRDLHEFPYFDDTVERMSHRQIVKKIEKDWGLRTCFQSECQEVNHGFTRYQATLRPILLSTREPLDVPNHFWHLEHELTDLPFSSGHRKILSFLSAK